MPAQLPVASNRLEHKCWTLVDSTIMYESISALFRNSPGAPPPDRSSTSSSIDFSEIATQNTAGATEITPVSSNTAASAYETRANASLQQLCPFQAQLPNLHIRVCGTSGTAFTQRLLNANTYREHTDVSHVQNRASSEPLSLRCSGMCPVPHYVAEKSKCECSRKKSCSHAHMDSCVATLAMGASLMRCSMKRSIKTAGTAAVPDAQLCAIARYASGCTQPNPLGPCNC